MSRLREFITTLLRRHVMVPLFGRKRTDSKSRETLDAEPSPSPVSVSIAVNEINAPVTRGKDEQYIVGVTNACLENLLVQSFTELTDLVFQEPFVLVVVYRFLPPDQFAVNVHASPQRYAASFHEFFVNRLKKWPALPAQSSFVLTAKISAPAEADTGPETTDDSDDNVVLERHQPCLSSAGNAHPIKVDDSGRVALGESHFASCLELFPENPAILRARSRWLMDQGQFEQAIADLSNALRQESWNAENYFLRALVYASLGNFSAALQDACDARQFAPISWNIYWLVAQIEMQRGNLEQARQELDQALQHFPEVPQIYVSRADLHCHEGEFAQAAEELSKAMELMPEWSLPCFKRAAVRLRLGKIDAAVSDSARGVALESNSLEAKIAHLELLIEVGHWPEVETLASELLGQETLLDAWKVLFFRGRAYSSLGKLELAVADFTAAIEQNPDAAEVRGHRALTLMQLDAVEAALEDADQVLAQGEMVPRMHWVRAVSRWNQDDRAGALEEIELAAQADLRDPFTTVCQARMLAMDERFEEGLEVLSRLQPDHESWETHVLRSELAARVGFEDFAWEEATKAVAELMVPPVPLVHRAKLALSRGQKATAYSDLQRVLDMDPEHGTALFSRGQLSLERGLIDSAVQDFWRAREAGVKLPPLGHHLISLLTMQKKFDKAKVVLSEYRELYPEAPLWWLLEAQLAVKEFGPGAAEQILRDAIEQFPETSESFSIDILLAEAQFESDAENYENALAKYAEALEFQSCDRNRILARRAGTLWYAGQCVEALDDLQSVLNEDDPDPLQLLSKGQILAELGESEESVVVLDQALARLDGEWFNVDALAYALSGRSLALAGLERWEEAWRDWERSLALCPDNGWLHFNGGWIHLAQRQPESAGWCFAIALQCNNPRLPRRKRVQGQGFLNLAATRQERVKASVFDEPFRSSAATDGPSSAQASPAEDQTDELL